MKVERDNSQIAFCGIWPQHLVMAGGYPHHSHILSYWKIKYVKLEFEKLIKYVKLEFEKKIKYVSYVIHKAFSATGNTRLAPDHA